MWCFSPSAPLSLFHFVFFKRAVFVLALKIYCNNIHITNSKHSIGFHLRGKIWMKSPLIMQIGYFRPSKIWNFYNAVAFPLLSFTATTAHQVRLANKSEAASCLTAHMFYLSRSKNQHHFFSVVVYCKQPKQSAIILLGSQLMPTPPWHIRRMLSEIQQRRSSNWTETDVLHSDIRSKVASNHLMHLKDNKIHNTREIMVQVFISWK